MRTKYKKVHHICLMTLVLASVFMVFLSSQATFKAEAVTDSKTPAQTCPADNPAFCDAVACNGTNPDCTQTDPALTAQCSTSKCDFIGKYINPAIRLLSATVGLVAVIALIVSGIQYSSAGGDPQKAASARGRIAKTIIGLIIYAFLYAGLQFLVPGGVFNR